MNRKITRLALPRKCAGLGASGLTVAAAADWAQTRSSDSSVARATVPRPTPASEKKWRRVMARSRQSPTCKSPCRYSCIGSLPRDEFVKIDQHPGDCGPGGGLDGAGRFGAVLERN